MEGSDDRLYTVAAAAADSTPQSSALGHMVWYWLLVCEPRLLEALWPIEASVPERVCQGAKSHPLSAQQWMVDFLGGLADATTAIAAAENAKLSLPTGVHPTTAITCPEERGTKSRLCSLAHFLLGIAHSREYGPWPFTNEPKAKEHIKTAADGGDKMAQFWLWSQYGDEYLDYVPKSASQGFCPALHALGLMHQEVDAPEGVPLNRTEGLRLLRVGAAEKGDAWCQFETAKVATQKEDALRLFKLASDQGLALAQYGLACSLLQLDDNTGNNERDALRLLKLSACQGVPNSLTMLGVFFLTGFRVERNYSTAVEYLSLASETGDPTAQLNLAQCYLDGKGVETDEAQALRLLQQASDSGLAEADVSIGVMYLEGSTAIPLDLTKACHHFQSAIQKNSECSEASFFLGVLMLRGVAPGTRQEGMALVQKSTESMAPATFVGLGEVYEYGVGGITRDLREASRWFRLAAASSAPTSSHVQKALEKLEELTRQP
ncbi:sel1 repeat family protein [Pelomyxa schiedti]|nr:sel1 repeat family protein [Pelomyxa schiedti]